MSFKRELKAFQLRDTSYTRTNEEVDRINTLIKVEKAFRRYARCHSADSQLEELEWNRFLKILKTEL